MEGDEKHVLSVKPTNLRFFRKAGVGRNTVAPITKTIKYFSREEKFKATIFNKTEFSSYPHYTYVPLEYYYYRQKLFV